jgi:hypothetical protein
MLDAILTLSGMLGLFAYVYRLAGKEDHQPRHVNSDATVTPHERSAGMNGAGTTA